MKRTVMAGSVLLAPPHAAIVVLYFVARFSGYTEHWLVDALSYVLPLLLLLSILHLPGAMWRRSPYLFSVAAVPLFLFAILYGPKFIPKFSEQEYEHTFSVMSYNVWVGNERFDLIIQAIEEQGPDVVGLQEITEKIADGIQSQLAERYPYQVIDGDQGIFSRFPILAHEVLYIGDPRVPIPVQFAVIEVEGRRIGVINAHPHSPALMATRVLGLKLGYPSGLQTRWRDWEVRELLDAMETIERPLVVLGDFNLTDLQAIYVDLTRTLRDSHADVGYGLGFTRTPLRGTGPPTWRIDYVFHSPDLVALRTDVGDFGGSDHRPVVAELAFGDG